MIKMKNESFSGNLKNFNDTVLIKKMTDGDIKVKTDAFNVFYERHEKALKNYIHKNYARYKSAYDEDLATVVLNDTFLNVQKQPTQLLLQIEEAAMATGKKPEMGQLLSAMAEIVLEQLLEDKNALLTRRYLTILDEKPFIIEHQKSVFRDFNLEKDEVAVSSESSFVYYTMDNVRLMNEAVTGLRPWEQELVEIIKKYEVTGRYIPSEVLKPFQAKHGMNSENYRKKKERMLNRIRKYILKSMEGAR
jgi:hypothetical protein